VGGAKAFTENQGESLAVHGGDEADSWGALHARSYGRIFHVSIPTKTLM
jgi:hypothetical protein